MPFAAAAGYARTVMGWANDPLPAAVAVTRDVAYGPHRLQRYNVFTPRGASNAQVLVFWHGGGWTNGYRDYASFLAPHVAALGMLLVAPSYRLAPEAPLPAAVDDALSLLADLQPRVVQWGGAMGWCGEQGLSGRPFRWRTSGCVDGIAVKRPRMQGPARRDDPRLPADQRHHGSARSGSGARQSGGARIQHRTKGLRSAARYLSQPALLDRRQPGAFRTDLRQAR